MTSLPTVGAPCAVCGRELQTVTRHGVTYCVIHDPLWITVVPHLGHQ